MLMSCLKYAVYPQPLINIVRQRLSMDSSLRCLNMSHEGDRLCSNSWQKETRKKQDKLHNLRTKAASRCRKWSAWKRHWVISYRPLHSALVTYIPQPKINDDDIHSVNRYSFTYCAQCWLVLKDKLVLA